MDSEAGWRIVSELFEKLLASHAGRDNLAEFLDLGRAVRNLLCPASFPFSLRNAASLAPPSKNIAKAGDSWIAPAKFVSAKGRRLAAAAGISKSAAPSAPSAVRSSFTDKPVRDVQMWDVARVARSLSSVAFDFVLVLDFVLVSGPNTPMPHTLDRKYEYRRNLPHYQKAGRAVFVTFCKANQTSFTPEASDAILHHCLHDNGKRYHLHATVVMPDHVHLLLTPLRDEKGWPYSLPVILKQLKGTSARSVNKLMGSCGPVWQEESFDHVLRSQESLEQKLEYIRQNPVRRGLAKRPEGYKWLWIEQTAGK